MTVDEFLSYIKTNVEQSAAADNLWIARSGIGMKVNNSIQPIFGFASSFDYTHCVVRANYELLEHVVFLPYFYDVDTINNPATLISGGGRSIKTRPIKEFLVGANFYGNGCAVSPDRQYAIEHSKRELLERHLCAEIWYNSRYRIFEEYSDLIRVTDPSIHLQFYTTPLKTEDRFIMAVLDCERMDFFALGAAIRPTVQAAIVHAASEVLMLFADVEKGRNGLIGVGRAHPYVLSLRNKGFSQQRKAHFEKKVCGSQGNHQLSFPTQYQTIVFQPMDNIFAARTFSDQASDPRKLESKVLPMLPLF